LIFDGGDFNPVGFSELGYFVLSNSVLGILVFATVKKILERYRKNEIKIAS
jgi:hypothetical protein